MENYSLSDLRAAVDGGNDGWGNGGGAWWIIILFLFVFMGGGWGMNRQGEFGQYATAASQQEILCSVGFMHNPPMWAISALNLPCKK